MAGHFGIGVTAQDREDRDKARRILKAHHGLHQLPWSVDYGELGPVIRYNMGD